jgi:hypothetical protein
MNSTVSRYKLHFANWRRWELNPIVVKELRQSVRSWAVTGMLLLFLAVLFCTSLVFLISQSFQVSANQRLGADIFQTFTVILTGASLPIRIVTHRPEAAVGLDEEAVIFSRGNCHDVADASGQSQRRSASAPNQNGPVRLQYQVLTITSG